MSAFWPHQPDDNPMAVHLNATPKYVATRTLSSLTWNNAHVLEGELRAAVQRLKSGDEGNIVVLGSGELVQQLIVSDVVDGYRLFLHPLLLGSGKRLFRSMATPTRLRLETSSATSTGVLMLNYAVESGAATGSGASC
jgi:dihydrofolate reductase